MNDTSVQIDGAGQVIETDVIIVGAGPVGLFAVFELGLLDIKCALIDILDKPGGQCAELYPEKPIYDIPGYPVITGEGLVEKLMEQIKPFHPTFHLGQMVETLAREADGRFRLTTDAGTTFLGKVGGDRGRRRLVPAEAAAGPRHRGLRGHVGLLFGAPHGGLSRPRPADRRRRRFGARLDAQPAAAGEEPDAASTAATSSAPRPTASTRCARWSRPERSSCALGQVSGLKGEGGQVSAARPSRTRTARKRDLACTRMLPFFGLTMKLGPVANWGLNLDENLIPVDTAKFETSEPGIFAIGDINTYPGKLKLILCGFHEAALMAQAAVHIVFPEKKIVFQYTTSSSSLQKKLGVI